MSSDTHWEGNAAVQPASLYSGFKLETFYVPMRDGVHIAIDVYLPTGPRRGVKDLRKYPTMLHMTRYFRNWQLTGSASLCSCVFCCCCFGQLAKALKINSTMGIAHDHWNMRSVIYTEFFLPRGYVWVSMDTRGTGASEGVRPVDMAPEEVADLEEVCAWVAEQPWCNGNIGTTGISYDGMLGMCLSKFRQPSLKAIAPLFSPYDLFGELAYPGGCRCIGFTESYTSFVHNLERNQPEQNKFPPLIDFVLRLATAGVRPAAGKAKLREAVAQHEKNYNMLATQRSIWNRDDEYDTGSQRITVDDISPHMHCKPLPSDVINMMIVSGWYDSGSVMSAVRAFLSAKKHRDEIVAAEGKTRTEQPRLLLGPWNHGARNNCSPFADSNKPSFPLMHELIRYFNEHLGVDPSDTESKTFRDGPPVRYYTVGAGRWNASDSWPPAHTVHQYNLDADNKLTLGKQLSQEASAEAMNGYVNDRKQYEDDAKVDDGCKDDYEVWFDATSGVDSRWNLVKHMFKVPIVYPNRAEQDARLLLYTSDPLESTVEMTGHPYVALWVSCNNRDAQVFAYLEEVLPNGRVIYVTEGQLRLSHRALQARPDDFEDCIPFRSCLTKHQEMLQPRKPCLGVIQLFATSYQFSAGSRIRLSLAGADTDNFDNLDEDVRATEISVHRGATTPSTLGLPIVQH